MTEEVSSPYWSLKGLHCRKICKRDSYLKSFIDYHSNLEIGESKLKPSYNIIKKAKNFDDLSIEEIGILGEKACFRFIAEVWKNNRDRQKRELVHHNQISESYKPYDISLCYQSNELIVETSFIDVKTTRYFENTPFHLSLKEAEFVKENYSNYFIVRVFPLFESHSYFGIQISSTLGMNVYKFDPETKQQFMEVVDEMKLVTLGYGFKIKSEWLIQIGLKDSWELSQYFNEYKIKTGLYEQEPAIWNYFRNAGVYNDNDKKLKDIKINVEFNEMFFLVK
ncbi:DUF3883 domain-containing protein [Mucilaginibacter sp.]|uniref:protein NO VEIN domain-containing protein n=1 Tax=Mucilaginibacter sp. TaxID=1882438 RepID=UPI0026316BE1|nr:DUF3883 domain-containing protein [Mucilaginibacter sp.]MDB4919759.1 hypothetical protein [Mucilaginibacter sp.]